MAEKKITINLQVKEDGSVKIAAGNLEKTLGKAVSTLQTQLATLNTTLKDFNRTMLGGTDKATSLATSLKNINITSFRSIKANADMLSDALRKAREVVNSMTSGFKNMEAGMVMSEKNMTRTVATESAKRMSIRQSEMSAGGQRPIGPQLNLFDRTVPYTMKQMDLPFAGTQYSRPIGPTMPPPPVISGWQKFKSMLGEIRTNFDNASKANDEFGKKTGFLAMKVVKLMIAFAILRTTIQAVTSAIKTAFTATEEYQQTVVETAAVMAMFSKVKPGQDFGEHFQESYKYAQLVVQEMEKLDMYTIASAKDLQQMVMGFAMGRMIINVTNKEAMDGFKNFANAVKVFLGQFPNQTAQIYQEIRAIMNGTAKATDTLAMLLKASLGGAWATILKQWKKEGPDVFFTKLGEQFKSFGYAAKKIEGLWATITSSMDTMYKMVFRKAFGDFNKTIKDFVSGWLDAIRTPEGKLTDLGNKLVYLGKIAWLELKQGARDMETLMEPIIESTKILLGFFKDLNKAASELGIRLGFFIELAIVATALRAIFSSLVGLAKMLGIITLVKGIGQIIGAMKGATAGVSLFRQILLLLPKAFGGWIGLAVTGLTIIAGLWLLIKGRTKDASDEAQKYLAGLETKQGMGFKEWQSEQDMAKKRAKEASERILELTKEQDEFTQKYGGGKWVTESLKGKPPVEVFKQYRAITNEIENQTKILKYNQTIARGAGAKAAELAPATVPTPSPGVEDEDAKLRKKRQDEERAYWNAKWALDKQNFTQEFELVKAHNDHILSVEEARYDLGLSNFTQYNEEKRKNWESNAAAELVEIDKQKKLLRDTAKGRITTIEADETITKKGKLEQGVNVLYQLQIELTKELNRENAIGNAMQLNALKEINDLMKIKSDILINQLELISTLKTMEVEHITTMIEKYESYNQKVQDYQLERGQISATQYYKQMTDAAERWGENQKTTIELELKRIRTLEEGQQEIAKKTWKNSIEIETTILASKGRIAIAEEDAKNKTIQAAQDTADKILDIQLESAQSIQQIYEKGSTWGVMKKALQDLALEYGKTWDDIYQATKDSVNAIAGTFKTMWSDFAKGEMKSFKEYMIDMLGTISDAFANAAINNMVAGLLKGLGVKEAVGPKQMLLPILQQEAHLKQLINTADQEAINKIPQLIAQTDALIISIAAETAAYWALFVAKSAAGALGGGGGGNLPAQGTPVTPGGGGYLHYQHGGPVKARTPIIVGEAGPELFIPKSSGTIIPNATSSSNIDVVINVENKTDSKVKATQSPMKFDGKKYVKGVVLELLGTDQDFKSGVKWGLR